MEDERLCKETLFVAFKSNRKRDLSRIAPHFVWSERMMG
jgi:hypothetical protein